jgi:hypothetical protein
MKLHDFGLWFNSLHDNRWTTSIPPGVFDIYYDGILVGQQDQDFILRIYDNDYIIRVTQDFYLDESLFYRIDRPLVMDDFYIELNPYNLPS